MFIPLGRCINLNNYPDFYKGSFKASEVSSSRPPPSASNIAPEPCIPISKVTPAVRHAQMMLQKSLKAGAAPPGTPVEPGITPMHTQVVYGKFISAVYSTIAQKLSREDRWIEMNASKFVHLHKDWHLNKSIPLQCFTLDIYLTGAGQLIISANTAEDSTIFPFHASNSHMEALDSILLAPGGMLAVVDDDSIAPETAASQTWKETVSNLLASKGIQLSEIDPENQWVLVRAWPSTTAADSDITLGTVFYWPQALCFRTAPSPTEDTGRTHGYETRYTDSDKLTPSSWFYSANEGGFLDSLQFAEDWYKAKVERDKIAQERQRKRKEIEAAAQKHAEPAGLAVASPFYTRGDLQTAGGMYPTPPDGVVSQPGTVPAGPDTIPAIATHGSPLPRVSIGGDMMDIDEMFGETSKRRATVESGNSMQMDVEMNHDDLFGPIDEDEFAGHDVTDADFNFFDEPDGDDEMLEPASSIPDIPTKSLSMHDKSVASTAVISSTDEAPQPDVFTALEEAVEGLVENHRPVPEDLKEPQKESTIIKTDEQVIMRPPLSPELVRKRLFAEMSNVKAGPRRRESQYDPLPFTPSLVNDDTKYSSGGAFGFAESDISSMVKRSLSRAEMDITLCQPKRKHTRRRPPRASESDDSSETSDASEDDSMSDFESLPLASSPAKGMFVDKRIVALQDGDATSVATSPGSYMAADDNPASGMSGNVQVSLRWCEWSLHNTKTRSGPYRVA